MQPIIIHSIYVGQPQTISDEKGEWSSSIYRTLVGGPIRLEEEGLTGDKVTDTKHHGRPFQAVCCHSLDHYEFWNEHYGLSGTEKALGPGSVGENWTLLNANEGEICVGDVYSVGGARVGVTGPRYPCAKQQRKVGLRAFQKRTLETLRTGFYLSVLTPGTVQAGDRWVLEERPRPDISLTLVNEVAHHTQDSEMLQLLVSTPELNDGWKQIFRRMLKQNTL